MILQALTKCYEALAKKNLVSKPGLCAAKVHFRVDLKLDGTVEDIVPLEDYDSKKKQFLPKIMIVPEQCVRSSGVCPYFLSDNSSYILGIDDNGKPKRTAEAFESSKKLHLEILEKLDSDIAIAIKNFFRKWNPQKATENIPQDVYAFVISKSNLIFSYDDDLASEDEEILAAWNVYNKNNAYEVTGQCLITGEYGNLRRLHPLIKGVWGTQSSGASLVSFNAQSYESYGQVGGTGLNAPVSEYAAFAYGTALNYMLSQEDYVIHMGDTTIVFWTADAEPEYGKLFKETLGQGDGDDITIRQTSLKNWLDAIACRKPLNYDGVEINYSNKFYILGLSPNAARISVRFFYSDTFGNILKNVMQHYKDLEIIKPSFEKYDFVPLWILMNELVNKNSKDKEGLKILTGNVFDAVLSGRSYPVSMYQNVLMRIHAEAGAVANRNKASIIKAYLNRYHRLYKNKMQKEEITVSLNPDNKDIAYTLGRLFAVYENIQDDASKEGLNATIKDRFFNAAMSTPGTVFPLLARLSVVHLKKLEVKNRVRLEKQVTELIGIFEKENGRCVYPKRLNLEQQGDFYVGYYHQVQKRYTKKEEAKND